MDFFTFSGFILGTILGSFNKALADRSLTKRSFWGRSYCESCHKKLSWYDLIPILSYLQLGGRCRYCKINLSPEYLLVELVMGALIAFLFYQGRALFLSPLDFPQQVLFVSSLLFKIFIISVLMIILLTDIKKGIIPDRITYPASIIALAYLLITSIFKVGLFYQSLSINPIGKYLLPPYSDYFIRNSITSLTPLWTGLLAAFLLSIFFGGLIFITKGKGMGGGDLKLGIFLGLAFGLPDSLTVMMLAFLTGSVVGLLLLTLSKKKLGQTVPFGPFLSLGGIITLYFGNQLLNLYLNLSLT